MLKNYIQIALRNLKKYKAFSFINIIGLAVGVACVIVIFLYVRDEMSYDKFNKDANQIYRVYFDARINSRDIESVSTSAPLGPTFKRVFPEVVQYTRIRNFGVPVMRYKEKVFSEDKVFWADSTFFNVFTVKFIQGDPKTALSKPNELVITGKTARKYFGNANPIGKILNADHRRDYVVTAVVKAFPHNSHFHFDMLASMSTYNDSKSQFWLSNNYTTYLVLQKGTNPQTFENKFNKYIIRFIGPQVKLAAGITFDQFKAGGNRYTYKLQPLTSIHLYSHLDNEIEPNGDINYIYIFSAIAIAILLIASINFMNLSTARSERRAKEVGIRKTLGSNKSLLVRQFIAESVLMSAIAVFIALGIVELFLPLFNDISGKQMTLHLLDNFYAIPALIGIAVVVGILAGSYPAFYLSSIRPVSILSKDSRKGSRKSILRSSLVIFQFAVSILLFIGTFIIYNQLDYIQNKNLGFNKDRVVIIDKTDDIGNSIESFKKQLLSNPKILDVSNSTSIPGSHFNNSAYKLGGTSGKTTQMLWNFYADYGFQKTYEIYMKEGRFFSKEHPSDTTAVVINEATANVFGLKNPIGKQLVLYGRSQKDAQNFKIIGVVKNFNFESLHQQIKPLVIHLLPKGGFGKYVSVRIAAGNYQKTIASMNDVWKNFAGNEAFKYNFFDQDWAHLYNAEQRTGKIASVFSILAIFIACLGLLGLAAFITEQRTKEIGIRKTLGASVPEIVFLLSKEFTKWVLIANIIAWPLAYYVMSNWLQNFAYRITIGPLIFVLSGLIALAIALLTVSSHAIRAARANPIKSLRYE